MLATPAPGGTWSVRTIRENAWQGFAPSADGRTAWFHSADPPGGHGKHDLWVCYRLQKQGAPGGRTAPVDLLKPVDPARNAVAGKWERLPDGSLKCSANSFNRLELPLRTPAEYQVRMVFNRLSGVNGVGLLLPRGDKRFAFMIGADGNVGVGPELVDGQPVGKSTLTVVRPGIIGRTGVLYELRVAVRDSGLTAWLDGVEVFRSDAAIWPRLTEHEGWKLPTAGTPGLAAWDSEVIFRTVELVDLTGVAVPPKP